jgi:hypothetical protein
VAVADAPRWLLQQMLGAAGEGSTNQKHIVHDLLCQGSLCLPPIKRQHMLPGTLLCAACHARDFVIGAETADCLPCLQRCSCGSCRPPCYWTPHTSWLPPCTSSTHRPYRPPSSPAAVTCGSPRVTHMLRMQP